MENPEDNNNIHNELIELIARIEKIPTEYYSRFALCVLDVVRKLQIYPQFENGVAKIYIMEYIKNFPFIDGDLDSQVSCAIKYLENFGYLMYMKNGYKTLGPFAKLCLCKSQREKRVMWKKLETKLNYGLIENEVITPMKRRKRNASCDSKNNESTQSTQNSQGPQ